MKQHHLVLDGLRGTAALSVFMFHIWESLVPGPERNPLAHTFFAVDFFFALPGFVAPPMGAANRLFEAACVIVVFPAILMAGARTRHADGTAGRIVRLAGELSYPVYILHYPFIYWFAHWNWRTHPTTPVLAAVACALYVGVILFAFALSRCYGRPMRAWLSRIALEGEAGPACLLPQVTV